MKARNELFLTGAVLDTTTIVSAWLADKPGWEVMKYTMVVAGVLGLCTAIVSGCYAAAGGIREEIVVAHPEKSESEEAGIPVELPRSEPVLVCSVEA